MADDSRPEGDAVFLVRRAFRRRTIRRRLFDDGTIRRRGLFDDGDYTSTDFLTTDLTTTSTIRRRNLRRRVLYDDRLFDDENYSTTRTIRRRVAAAYLPVHTKKPIGEPKPIFW